jgi:uncharacterized protein with von Willebrand factor type A (vWA) domain
LGGIDCLSRWILQSSKTKLAGLHQYIVFLVFHGKSTTFLKQLVKKIREITEVEHKIGKSKKRRQISAKVNNFQDY